MADELLVNEEVTIVTPDNQPYLKRKVLVHHADGSKLFLHYIYQSDQDRHPHDHPWDFKSLIVSGSYYDKVPIYRRARDGRVGLREDLDNDSGLEFIYYERKLLRPGDWNIKRVGQLHAVELVEGPVITLVWAGPKKAEWGFFTEDGWVHNEDYLKEPKVVD